MQVQRTINRREGVWGIVKGDKGGASQVAPLSPLTKEQRLESSRDSSYLSLRASKASVATNRQGILMILALYTVDCFGYRLAMTMGSVHKNFIVMLSEAKHLLDSTFLDSACFRIFVRFYSLLFSSRGTGGLIAKQPPIPL